MTTTRTIVIVPMTFDDLTPDETIWMRKIIARKTSRKRMSDNNCERNQQ